MPKMPGWGAMGEDESYEVPLPKRDINKIEVDRDIFHCW